MSNIDLLAEVIGDKILIAKLKLLQTKGQRAIARKSLGKGMTVMAGAMRKAAPVGKKKEVKKSIGQKLKKNRKTGLHESIVGINVGRKIRKKLRVGQVVGGLVKGAGSRAKFQEPHAHLNALGTKPRFHKKTGKFVGSMPRNPFIARAFMISNPPARRTIRKWVARSIAEWARKG